MPEIAEAARIVHFLKTHLVGKRIKAAKAIDDASVFGKAGTTGDEVATALEGKKVVDAGSQGKYFCPPHPVMHFGMTGWLHIKGMRTGYTSYYNKLKPDEADLWPPKYWKFQLETDSSPKIEAAFTDPRRFGRVRLVDCPGKSIRSHPPLVDNGPDPVVDAATTFTEAYFVSTLRRRHVPIKALLLDQAFISGIGNWVGDEVLFHARLHPEQYCDQFSDEQMASLYNAIRYVCRTAVDLLGDSDQFPDDWLFRHRWGKGNKNEVARLPSGEALAFLTVGGRTSCYAPELQKKSGAVAPGIKEEAVVTTDDKPSKTAAKTGKADKTSKTGKTPTKTSKAAAAAAAPVQAPKKAERPVKAAVQAKKRKRGAVKEDVEEEDEEDEPEPKPRPSSVPEKKRGKTVTAASKKKETAAAAAQKKATAAQPAVEEKPVANTGRRRSARLGTS